MESSYLHGDVASKRIRPNQPIRKADMASDPKILPSNSFDGKATTKPSKPQILKKFSEKEKQVVVSL